MGLPDGNWDIASYDGDTESELNADWNDVYPSEPTYSGGVLHWVGDATGMVGSPTSILGPKTAAAGVQLLGGTIVEQAFLLGGYVLANGTTHVFYVIATPLGTYATPDGATFEQLDTTDYLTAPHEMYVVLDTTLASADFYVDGSPISEGYPLYDLGSDIGFEATLAQCGIDTEADVSWIGFSTEAIVPEGGGEPTSGPSFTLGATGIVFTIDEYAQYSSLSADQILTHYRAGRGIPQ